MGSAPVPVAPSFSLRGRVALVTGSSRGIGRSAAFALGRAGAAVVFHGSRQSAALDKALEDARAEGIDARCAVGDIGDSAAVARICAECAAADILVLNASVQSYGRLAEFGDAEFERMANANVRSTFQFIQALGPCMAERGWGRIVAIGSVNQSHPAPRLAIYASTKAAMRAVVLTAAKEYAARGVTVNTVTPGVIATDRNAAALSDKAFADALLSMIPAGRFGCAADCAGPILMLASDAASYITGADIVVDGGMTL